MSTADLHCALSLCCAGIRTSRLSSDATGDSDSDEEAGESGGEDDDLPFKFD
jgi:hypothetical protein